MWSVDGALSEVVRSVVGMTSAPDLDPWDGDAACRFPSPDEVAYAEELIRLDRET